MLQRSGVRCATLHLNDGIVVRGLWRAERSFAFYFPQQRLVAVVLLNLAEDTAHVIVARQSVVARRANVPVWCATTPIAPAPPFAAHAPLPDMRLNFAWEDGAAA